MACNSLYCARTRRFAAKNNLKTNNNLTIKQCKTKDLLKLLQCC